MSYKNRAIVKQKPGQAIITDVPVPPLRPGYMLVRTHAVALNPADWTDVDYSDYYGCIVGIDYGGVVVEVGGQTVRSFKTGDRVAGSAHGCNTLQPSDGAFAQYILVKTDLQIHIPDSMSFEEAASLGVGILTSGMGLFHEMGLPLPADPSSEENFSSRTPKNNSWILIYGGSSATGSIAIQSGFRVVTTCSPHNFGLVLGLGADLVFNYRDPNIVRLISEATADSLIYAFDTIATDDTASICVSSFMSKTDPGKKATYVSTLDPTLPSVTPLPVEKRYFLGYTTWGEDFVFEGEEFAASKRDYDFAVGFVTLAERLLHQGSLKNHPVAVDRQGTDLEGVIRGMKLLKEGKVSGEKLVYTIQQSL